MRVRKTVGALAIACVVAVGPGASRALAEPYNCRTPAYAKAHPDECGISSPFTGGAPGSGGGGGSGGLLGGILHSIGL